MRKINVSNEDLNRKALVDLLSGDEFFTVKLRDSYGEVFIGHFARECDHSRVFFISDNSAFDGCSTYLRDNFDMEYSWSCGGFTYAHELIGDSENTRDYEFLGIAEDKSTTPTSNVEVEHWDFINNQYSTSIIYSGIEGYHSMRQYNAPITETKGYKIGVELEVECNDGLIKDKFDQKFKSNWLLMERDGSLSDCCGIEFITIPMFPKHIKAKNTWFDFIKFMSTRAQSWNTSTCGLHVHIGREILGKNPEIQSETLGKLLYLYHHFLKDHDVNIKIYGRREAYNDHDGKVDEANAVKILGKEVLALGSVQKTLKDKLMHKNTRTRYFDINLQNVHTIEFRKGRGSLNVERIISVIEYSELMCKYARTANWTDMSVEDFFNFVRKNIKVQSPLQRYFNNEIDA